ncbi:MAG: hypothetical protein HY222_07390 [Thaumarchaeota archaeon]|nr:hypothetical protein [Nitrososphaerota archaeon]MBI3642198.1 hypothetical protein [Nitrososphaerota archaeon]
MRRFTGRRGLSTIVTTALMLTAVAVLGTAIVSWSNGNLKSYETVLSNAASNNINKINENLVIENIAFCAACASPSNSVINVTLTNTGTISIKINQIQINSTVITSYAKSTTLPQNISPQNSYTVAAQLPTSVTWKSKSVDTITVTTARGSTYTTQAAPP